MSLSPESRGDSVAPVPHRTEVAAKTLRRRFCSSGANSVTDVIDPEAGQTDELIEGMGRISCRQQAGRWEGCKSVRYRANSPCSLPLQLSHTHCGQRVDLRGALICNFRKLLTCFLLVRLAVRRP